MSFLRPDSEFMNAVSKCVDYIILNLLCVLCCIPIVTIGASLTAKYYVSMKLVRKEEPVVTKAFFSAFKINLRQSTIIWAILGGILLILALDWYIITRTQERTMNSVGVFLLAVVTVLVLGTVFCVFPMVARFYITTKEVIRGAVIFVLMKLPRVLLMLAVTAATYFVALWYLQWFPAIWIFSTTVMLYYNSRMFVKEFEKIEQRDNTRENDTENENHIDMNAQ